MAESKFDDRMGDGVPCCRHARMQPVVKRVERSAEIPVPADRVFALVSSLADLPRWQAGIRSAEQTSAGPMGVGATAIVVRELMGQRIEAPLTVTAYEPPHLLALSSEVSTVRADAAIEVVPRDASSSRVTFSMEINASGLTAFMEPMIAAAAERDLAASLERLATVLAQS